VKNTSKKDVQKNAMGIRLWRRFIGSPLARNRCAYRQRRYLAKRAFLCWLIVKTAVISSLYASGNTTFSLCEKGGEKLSQ